MTTIKLALDENAGPCHLGSYNLLMRCMDKFEIEGRAL